jgi:hypothetical protein
MTEVTIPHWRYDELLKKEATLEVLARYYEKRQYVSAEDGLLILGNTEEEK